jgi:hypothetical protein
VVALARAWFVQHLDPSAAEARHAVS